MLRGRGIELDVELDAPTGRHHDRIGARLRLWSPHLVGEWHAIEARNLDRNAPNDAGPVDIGKMQADVGIRRSIDETPKLLPAGSKADLGRATGRVAGVADRDSVDAQKRFLLPFGGCRALNLRGCVDAFAERALRQSGGDSGSRRAGRRRRDRRLRTTGVASGSNRWRFRGGCVFRLRNEMVAHDQNSIGDPMLSPRIVVGVLDHDCPG